MMSNYILELLRANQKLISRHSNTVNDRGFLKQNPDLEGLFDYVMHIAATSKTKFYNDR